MVWIKRILALALVAGLFSCVNGPESVDAKVASACTAYSGVITTLVPLVPKMSASQRSVLRDVQTIVSPTCKQAADRGIAGLPVEDIGVLRTRTDETRKLLLLKATLQPGDPA